MVWFNVDDGFYDHPKVKAIPRGAPRKGALALWLLAGTWNAKYHHDGLIPLAQIDELGGSIRDVEHLTTVRLWHPPGYLCTDERCTPVPHGYVGFHQWAGNGQQTKEQVEAKKAAARERQARARARKHQTPESRRDTTPEQEGTSRDAIRLVTP